MARRRNVDGGEGCLLFAAVFWGVTTHQFVMPAVSDVTGFPEGYMLFFASFVIGLGLLAVVLVFLWNLGSLIGGLTNLIRSLWR